jgi:FixJ family two-component response regulator
MNNIRPPNQQSHEPSGKAGDPARTPASTHGEPLRPLIHVVDDDPSMREALARLFRSVGLETRLYASTVELLANELPDVESCIVLDVRLPGMSGLDFQSRLARGGGDMPIVFVTGHGDIPMTVRAMKAGAVDFLTKPFRDQDMLDAVSAALARDRARRQGLGEVRALLGSYETLTAREREVLSLVVTGLMNKQIAAQLGVSEITIKIHRHNMMKKMGAGSVPDLVRMAEALQTHGNKPTV